MSDRVSFRCADCNARLTASVRLVGRAGPCPTCGGTVVVPPRAPAEEGPILVADDGHPEDRGPVARHH